MQTLQNLICHYALCQTSQIPAGCIEFKGKRKELTDDISLTKRSRMENHKVQRKLKLNVTKTNVTVIAPVIKYLRKESFQDSDSKYRKDDSNWQR